MLLTSYKTTKNHIQVDSNFVITAMRTSNVTHRPTCIAHLLVGKHFENIHALK
jgi:hypothetical protein